LHWNSGTDNYLTKAVNRQNTYKHKIMQYNHNGPSKQHKTYSKETKAKRERGQTEPGLVAFYGKRPGN